MTTTGSPESSANRPMSSKVQGGHVGRRGAGRRGVARRQVGGQREAVGHVAQPPAEDRQVDGEHQGAVAGLPGPAGEVVGVGGGVPAVELEPLRRAGSVAATSASGVLADVDTVISAPTAAAPRAEPRSPSGCASAW